MRTLTVAAIVIALLPTTAYSQQRKKAPAVSRTDEQLKTDAEVDKAYQNTLKATGGKAAPGKIDPWQSVRTPSDNNAKR
jgi:hypothetical protein